MNEQKNFMDIRPCGSRQQAIDLATALIERDIQFAYDPSSMTLSFSQKELMAYEASRTPLEAQPQ